jgi:transposase-like protein
MKTKEPKDEQDELTLVSLAQEYADEDKARGLLESLYWPNGPVCPHCKNTGTAAKGVVALTSKATSKRPGRKGLYFCGSCRKQFSVTVGTVFEGSHIPISKWLMAMFIICSSKKSISANQLHRMLKITYKTSWFMLHRIRHAMSPEIAMLKGTVEVDETYVGGKGDQRTVSARKTPVVALVERGGKMQARVLSNVTQKNLGQVLNEVVSKDAIVNTDEHPIYRNPLKNWKAHQTVTHSKYEYTRKNDDGSMAGINHCESFFSLLKRGV